MNITFYYGGMKNNSTMYSFKIGFIKNKCPWTLNFDQVIATKSTPLIQNFTSIDGTKNENLSSNRFPA